MTTYYIIITFNYLLISPFKVNTQSLFLKRYTKYLLSYINKYVVYIKLISVVGQGFRRFKINKRNEIFFKLIK